MKKYGELRENPSKTPSVYHYARPKLREYEKADDGGYCTSRPRGTFEAWGRVNWAENKDSELGIPAMVDLVTVFDC